MFIAALLVMTTRAVDPDPPFILNADQDQAAF